MFTKRDNYSLIFLVLVLTIFFSPAIFTCTTYFLRDITYIFHPWKTLCSELIQKGKIPLWNPYAYCGMPLLANLQSAVFYPFSLVFYLFSFPAAIKFYYFLHLFIAGFFAFLFGRKLGFSRISSTGMMILFALNGFILTKLEFLSHAAVDVWPFALLIFVQHPLCLGIALTFAFLAGHQIFLYQLFMLFTYLFITTPQKQAKLALKSIVIAGILALSAVSVQLIPTIELASLSSRAKTGIDTAIAMLHSLRFVDFVNLINPYLSLQAADLVTGERFQWDTTMYLGITSTLVILTGIFKSRLNRTLIWSFLLVFTGAIFALGSNTPIYPWLYRNIPVFNTMRYPVQFVFIAIVGFTLLLGNGLNVLDSKLKSTMKAVILLFITVELLIIGFNFQPRSSHRFFYNKSKVMMFLQKNLGNNRFILSPGTEKNRYLSGSSVVNAWQKARSYLYNLTCLPLHLSNAYGFGEPLTLNSIEGYMDRTYKKPTAQDSLGDFKNLGIKYLICRQKLDVSSGYKLVYDDDLFIYRISEPAGIYDIIDQDDKNANITVNNPGKVVIEVNSNEKTQFLWREMFYPGWELYINGKQTTFSEDKGIFKQWEIPQGKSIIYHLYNPASFRIGLILSILSIIILFMFCIIKCIGISYAHKWATTKTDV